MRSKDILLRYSLIYSKLLFSVVISYAQKGAPNVLANVQASVCDPICDTLYFNDFENSGQQDWISDYPHKVWRSQKPSLINAPWVGNPKSGSWAIVIDGSAFPGRAWKKTAVPVQAGKDYCFSFWIRNIKNDPNFPEVVFLINGEKMQLNPSYDTTYAVPVHDPQLFPLSADTAIRLPFDADSMIWIRLCGEWQANSNYADLSLASMTNSIAGNDFMIDDMLFGEKCDDPTQGLNNENDLLNTNSTLHVYPLPVKKGSSFTASWSATGNGISEISVLDGAGRMVYKNSYNTNTGKNHQDIYPGSLEAGVYILILKNEYMYRSSKLIVIE